MARAPLKPAKPGSKSGRAQGRVSLKGPGASPKKASGRAKGKGKGGSSLSRLWSWTLRIAISALVGLVLGGGLVLAGLYRAALQDVDKVVAGPIWAASGKIMSGPQVIWTGLQLSPADLAEDLVAAGYVKTSKASRPGDFQVSQDAVMVNVPAAKGTGWSATEGEVLVSFRGDRVASVSPKGRATFAPAELTAVRGSDNERRRPVALSAMPEPVVKGVLAMEDARFYDHEGVDPLGIARAVFVNTMAGSTVQGGSTLTQQLAKNLFLSTERTLQRKSREALLAVALERRLSKNEVLELYLNGVYLGQASGASVYGVDQGAQAFFGKPLARLELGEAAMLGGIISAPNRYNPLQHPDKATERRNLTLDRMAELGWADKTAVAAEKKKVLVTNSSVNGRRAPWTIDAALASVEETLGSGSVAARGVTVNTTIQPALQRLAEHVVAQSLAELDKAHPKAAGAQMALVAMRASDGAILAMVGGRDYEKSPYNRALSGRRQVGSTVKPLTAVFSFEADQDLSPGTLFDDAPISRIEDGKPWNPKNYDGQFVGPITLRDAIRQSRNIPAVLLSERVGMAKLEDRWHSIGLSTATAWKSSALGGFGATPVELASAYTLLPSGGLWRRALLVREAVDSTGAVLVSEEPVTARRASARAAFLTTSMLADVVTGGTGKAAATYGAKGAVAGKTGTTDDARDAWMVGYSRDLVVVVWVGFDRDRALGLSGGQAALPAWARFMAGTGTLSGSFTPPADVAQVSVCASSGQLPRPGCPLTTMEWFSRPPTESCTLHGGPVQQIGTAAASIWDRIQGEIKGEDAAAPEEPKPRKRLFGRDEG